MSSSNRKKKLAHDAPVKQSQEPSSSHPQSEAFTTDSGSLQRTLHHLPQARPETILALQQSHGNQAVQRLMGRQPNQPASIQRKVVQRFLYDEIVNNHEDGDMIYGLGGGRNDTVLALDPTRARTDNIGQEVMIDDLNNQFIGTGVLGDRSKNGVTYPDNKVTGRPSARATRFQQYLEGHSRYDPRDVPAQNRSVTRVKRACKGGLEFVTKVEGKKIDFILDNINMDMVVNKTGPYDSMGIVDGEQQRDITGAELRFLYRNRKDKQIMNNVRFWKGGQQVEAPWEESSDLWDQYKQARALKAKSNKSGKNKKGCFLTTACVEYKALADDCEELTMLRAFRDGYMASLPEGEAMIREYYRIAPTIVARIWEDEEYAQVLEEMYQVVTRCVEFIKRGDNEAALAEYTRRVLDLKAKYLEPMPA